MTQIREIAATEIVPSTEHAYKIGGRWYWVTGFAGATLDTGSRFAYTVPIAKDPRYAQTGRAKLRYIGAYSTVLVREQEAPHWDWVTKQIERQEAAHCGRHLEFRSDCYSCRSEREFA